MTIRDDFFQVVEALCSRLVSSEFLACWFCGEDSNFVRFNRNRIRQSGHVRQLEMTLNLIDGKRHASMESTLTGNLGHDIRHLETSLQHLRKRIGALEPDPYLNFNSDPEDSETINGDPVRSSFEVIASIITAADGMDLVGFYADGTLFRGFANSLGQHNWYSKANFNFDWSCYLEGDKAVKSRYAGFQWNLDILHQKLAKMRVDLMQLAKPAQKLSPGQYRVFLAPSAVAEIIGLLSWNGFGLKNHKTKQSPLIKLSQNTVRLDPRIHIKEDNVKGIAPNFSHYGFIKPDSVTLIDKGQYAGSLVNARSAKEFEEVPNADRESPQSLVMESATLQTKDILRALDTGIYINNLWYSNYSDKNDCRITGMTRFACFWVENAQIQAPIEVMRFDESLYRMLGENLLELTREQELIFDTDTYERRSVSGMTLPGLLIKDFTLTL